MKLPTLSVVIPNYNHAHYLPEALGSVLQQSVQPIEIIVVDDGSKDNSLAVLEEIASKHPSVKVYRNEKNQGVVATMNRGLELARGEFVFLTGADDRILPGYFEKALAELASHPEAGLCFPNPSSFDHDTGKIKHNQLNLSKTPRYFSADELVKLPRLHIPGGSILKRSAVLTAGSFLPPLKWHCDAFLLCVVAFRHGACYLPESLYLWRATPQSYMTAGLLKWKSQWEVLQRLMDYLESPAYQDVRQRFQESSVLGLNPRITLMLLSKRKYWSYLNLPLLIRALPMDIFWTLPHWLQRLLRRILSH